MVRLHCVVEGQTEETFVKQILRPHLANQQIMIDARCVMTGTKRGKTYRGGMTSYVRAKRDIERWIKGDRTAYFTTMFDLYGLPTDFPGYVGAKRIRDPRQRVDDLENALRNDIDDGRFVPYIQLYEFETLLLADPHQLASQFPEQTAAIQKLVEMSADFTSPEEINDGADTAPSKRIIDAIPAYAGMKVSAGPIVAERIGLPILRARCRHFGAWLDQLEALARKTADPGCAGQCVPAQA